MACPGGGKHLTRKISLRTGASVAALAVVVIGYTLAAGIVERFEGRTTQATSTLIGEAVLVSLAAWASVYLVRSSRTVRVGAIPAGPSMTAVVGTVATAAFTLVLISEVVRRLDGHAVPTGALVIVAVFWAVLATMSIAAWQKVQMGASARPAVATASVASGALSLVTLVATAAAISDIARRVSGHAKPGAVALIGEIVAMVLLWLITGLAWRATVRRARTRE
jgi:hypothetical protein